MIESKPPLLTYRIVNPCDPLTMRAPNLLVAGAACCAISTAFGVEGPDGRSPLVFGWEEWFKEQGVEDLGAYLRDHADEIADALTSVLLGEVRDRHKLDKMLAALPDEASRQETITKRNNEIRTSMNNIERLAHAMASAFRTAHSENA